MKCHVSKLLMALGLAGAATAASALEWAATNETINFPFRPDNAVQTLTARVDAYSNSTMGFKGWTHHSSWLYMKLKKGELYNITVDTSAVPGFHPGLTCWKRPLGNGYVPINFAPGHFYNQWSSIMDPNAVNEVDKAKLGKGYMYFAVNGWDRDGLGDILPEQFQQGNMAAILDGEAGKVTVQLLADYTGFYQCVVGGIAPEPPVEGTTLRYPMQVSVSGKLLNFK